MVPASALLVDHERERRQLKQRLAAFDRALDDLRKAKERLAAVSSLYLERLEGVRRERDR